MGWDQDSQVMDGLAEHRAYHTVEKHSQKLVRKHTQKYNDKTIGGKKERGTSLIRFFSLLYAVYSSGSDPSVLFPNGPSRGKMDTIRGTVAVSDGRAESEGLEGDFRQLVLF